MGRVVRNRFVAFDLAEGWIELSLAPWTFSPLDGAATLRLSTFPVATDVEVTLASLQTLTRERRRLYDADRFTRNLFVDETSWTEGAVFCVQSTDRRLNQVLGIDGIARDWSISDGKYMLEANLWVEKARRFDRVGPACETMMRSVRFEGPS